eukprot:1164948-Pleurochrysis_carterae.AAC.2
MIEQIGALANCKEKRQCCLRPTSGHPRTFSGEPCVIWDDLACPTLISAPRKLVGHRASWPRRGAADRT